METLRKLGDDLVAHGEELEKFGLVDYQMGVAEEEIIRSKRTTAERCSGMQMVSLSNCHAVLGECIDLLATDEEDEPQTESGGPSNQITGSR